MVPITTIILEPTIPEPFIKLTSIILLNIIIYYRTLSYGLVIDDIDWYKKWPNGLPKLSDYKYNIFDFLYSRLYGGLTFGRNIPLDHAITLSLHIITALLISIISFPAALLFSVHPATHMTSTWITGRRYSILNILFVLILISKLYLLIPLILIFLYNHLYNNYLSRSRIYKSTIPITTFNILATISVSIQKISGLYKPSFIYNYKHIIPFLPFSQPAAERYLSTFTISFCILIGKYTQHTVIPLLPIYALLSLSSQPMYKNIQSFYNSHYSSFPKLKKLPLLKYLYPEINVQSA